MGFILEMIADTNNLQDFLLYIDLIRVACEKLKVSLRYIRIYIYTHIHAHTLTHAQTHTHTHTHIHIYIYIY